jgi:hypothetical protein
MYQKFMNVRARCAAGDFIYANNANRNFCTNMVYTLPLYVGKGSKG